MIDVLRISCGLSFKLNCQLTNNLIAPLPGNSISFKTNFEKINQLSTIKTQRTSIKITLINDMYFCTKACIKCSSYYESDNVIYYREHVTLQ